MSGFELAWKRNPETGNWLATDDRVTPSPVYVAGRDELAARGRTWTITVAVPGRSGTQTRAGFSNLTVAKGAALHTRCNVCFRHRPFADVEESGGSGGWRCRDRENCAEADAAKMAMAEAIRRESRNTDMDEIGVTDTADGPELVLVKNGTRTRTECTETDLDRLFRVLARRMRDRAMADVRDMLAQAGAMPDAHDGQEERP